MSKKDQCAISRRNRDGTRHLQWNGSIAPYDVRFNRLAKRRVQVKCHNGEEEGNHDAYNESNEKDSKNFFHDFTAQFNGLRER